MIDVTYILSVNYSGSHMLSELLGAHSHCASIGELRNYRKFSETGHERTTESDFGANPVFAGLGDVPEAQWYPLIHRRIAENHPEVRMLVDNSKKPDWAARFLRHPEIRPHFVHLIRDPRALLRRWRLTFDSVGKRLRQRRKLILGDPARTGVALAGSDYQVWIYKWLVANRRISDFVRAQGRPGPVLTYHDLATRTEEVLRPLMADLGLDFEPGQLHFGSGRSFGTRKSEYVELSARSEIRLDLRWQEELPSAVQREVVTNPQVLAYLDELGLRFCDAGLTRHGAEPGR